MLAVIGVAVISACGNSGHQRTRAYRKVGSHKPNAVEMHSLKKALDRYEVGVTALALARIANSDPAWARVRTGGAGRLRNHDEVLFQKERRAWIERYVFPAGEPADGACLVAPASIVEDLYKTRCPPKSMLRARSARKPEIGAILAGFMLNRSLRKIPNLTLLRCSGKRCESGACVSIRFPRWASALLYAPGANGVVWMRRAHHRWNVAYETLTNSGGLPPGSVVLSLASCVGYNPGDYGG